jgi:hypothetical protein
MILVFGSRSSLTCWTDRSIIALVVFNSFSCSLRSLSVQAFNRRQLASLGVPHQRMSKSACFTVEKQHEWITSSLAGNGDSSLPKQEKSTSTASNGGRKPFSTHLILHFDINETILLGDDAGGDSRHDSVQKMLAKSAFCQLPPHDSSSSAWEDTQESLPSHWWDGQEMGSETSLPPLYTGWEWPPGCCPYYRTGYKKFSKRFVEEHHGRIYKPVLDACEEALAQNSASNHILPAFFHTLEQLIVNTETKNESFQIVFRTFGSDIEDIAQVVTEFAQGKHPDYPDVRYPALELSKERLYQGRWKAISPIYDEKGSKENPSGFIYELWNTDETKLVASGDDAILQVLSQHSICGIRDDYRFWKRNGWDPTAGKPVWIPSYGKTTTPNDDDKKPYDHHLFFDDNIHNLEHDGIACVRRQVSSDGAAYITLDGATMHHEAQGVHLLRVPTIEPVLNPNWYMEQIQLARERLQDRLEEAAEQNPGSK